MGQRSTAVKRTLARESQSMRPKRERYGSPATQSSIYRIATHPPQPHGNPGGAIRIGRPMPPVAGAHRPRGASPSNPGSPRTGLALGMVKPTSQTRHPESPVHVPAMAGGPGQCIRFRGARVGAAAPTTNLARVPANLSVWARPTAHNAALLRQHIGRPITTKRSD